MYQGVLGYGEQNFENYIRIKFDYSTKKPVGSSKWTNCWVLTDSNDFGRPPDDLELEHEAVFDCSVHDAVAQLAQKQLQGL